MTSDEVTAEVEGGLELSGTLANAFRHGRDDGVGLIGTDYVLAALARQLPAMRRELSPHSVRIRHGLRSGGTEPALSPGISDQDFETLALLRAASRDSLNGASRRASLTSSVWTEGVRSAVGEALLQARHNGAQYAHGMHLVVAILGNRDYDACHLLRSLGIEAADLLRQLPVTETVRENGTPIAFVPNLLSLFGVLETGGRQPALNRLRPWVGRRLLRLPRTGVFLPFVEQEAIRQAVRGGSGQVTEAHLLVALVALEQQLLATGKRFGEPWGAYNGAGALLRECAVGYRPVAVRAAQFQAASARTDRRRRWRGLRGEPAFGFDAAEAVERAERLASENGHRYTGTSHLLAAMLTYQDGLASRLLQEVGVDTGKVKATTTSRLKFGDGRG